MHWRKTILSILDVASSDNFKAAFRWSTKGVISEFRATKQVAIAAMHDPL